MRTGASELRRLSALAPLSIVIVMLAGCDALPTAFENDTSTPIIVEYATRDGKCDLAKSETLRLKPGEGFVLRCPPEDLISVRFRNSTGQTCSWSQAEVARRMRKNEGYIGSYTLSLRACRPT